MKPHIAFIGVKHCGKSTAGKKKAQETSSVFYDIDEVIESLSSKTARTLYDEGGKALFQKWETIACTHICTTLKHSPQQKAVIASGGGICDNQEAITILHKYCTFIYLKVSEQTAFARIEQAAQQDGRYPAYISCEHPANADEAAQIFHRFFIERSNIYEKLADIIEENTST